jgi:hypothetical protein
LFTVTHDVLQRALNRCHFPLPTDGKGLVIVGIRAALPVIGSQSVKGKSVGLERASTDNIHPRCTILIWDRANQEITAFPSSTVPHLDYIKAAKAVGGVGANELALGLHRGYSKSLHPSRSGKFQHRALRIERKLPVLRTSDDYDYDGDDSVDFDVVYDNIHCAWASDTTATKFASAGCQVIVGFANPPVGPWKEFDAQIYGTPQQEFDYVLFGGGEIARVSSSSPDTALPLALRNGSEGDAVAALQQALVRQGFPLKIDGEFGIGTFKAVRQFQRTKMLDPDPDGVAGEQTLTALNLDVINPVSGADVIALKLKTSDPPIGDIGANGTTTLINLGSDSGIKITVETLPSGNRHHYATRSGQPEKKAYLGFPTKPNLQASVYTGLVQHVPYLEAAGGTKYKVADWTDAFGNLWPQLILPTAIAESALHFERLNTYDRAKFTFGFFQAAAHYPDDNFILILRDLLTLEDAKDWFPELSLVSIDGTNRVHLDRLGRLENLEVSELIPRPNDRLEPQLVRFLDWLNPTLQEVENQEVELAARFCLWTRMSEKTRKIQVRHAIRGFRARMLRLKNELRGRPVDQCILAADCLYQGRANIASIKAALSSDQPFKALKGLNGGPTKPHKGRVLTVTNAISSNLQDLKDLRFDPGSPELFS